MAPGGAVAMVSGSCVRWYQAVERECEYPVYCSGAGRGAWCSFHCSSGHEQHEEDIVECGVAAEGAGGFGVVEGAFQEFGDSLSFLFESRADADVDACEFAEGVDMDHGLDERSEQDEEGIGVAVVLGCELRDTLDVLAEDLRGEGAAVGEVAVEGGLSDAGVARDLAHCDVGGFCEELPCCLQDRVTVALGVLARLFARGNVLRGRDRHLRIV